MRLILFCTLIIIFPLLSVFGQQSNRTTSSNEMEFVNWAKEKALEIKMEGSQNKSDDILQLKKTLAGVRVIALGEPAHGFPEPLAFRNRLFKFLVENCGYTSIVLESDLAGSHNASKFVSGLIVSALDSVNLTRGMSKENMALIRWMRTYNQNASNKRKIGFFGMDMQQIGFPGDTSVHHMALDNTMEYLTKTDKENAQNFKDRLETFLPRMSVKNYAAISIPEHDKLSGILDDLISYFEREKIRLIASSSTDEFEWAYRNAVAARQTNRLIRLSPPEIPGKIPPEGWALMSSRDASMAENVLWVLQRQSQGGNVLVFAHNAHVKGQPTKGSVWDAFSRPPNAMGEYLRSQLGQKLYILGSSVGANIETAQEYSFDRALNKVGLPRYFLDLRQAKEKARVLSYLSTEIPMEANTRNFLNLKPVLSFDGILYMDKTQ
ncbi:erythromycin esterase family protein [Pedobacter paludis]|uniref:Erythromycin esterase n=1 Tax=Pedobacter paludis TaxID=2203212 RepID=A0A317F342_9SPHI|nr:erythromycin esterase family protein [Pedobacter paludis]PWS32269.1 hypothetical protein DF947_10905 [Pedobacter paludis]